MAATVLNLHAFKFGTDPKGFLVSGPDALGTIEDNK